MDGIKLNQDGLPELPSMLDDIVKEVRPYLLDPRENYPDPYYLLEFNGVPFSPLGGIQAISGQKKNGKSMALVQLMAAILGNDSTRAQTYVGGLSVPQRTIDHLGHQPRVLYVDTEMEKLNSAKNLRRVHWLCDWDMQTPHENFNVLWLRNVTEDKERGLKAFEYRFRLIRLAIEMLSPDVVFIDGIRDIIGDFNNNEESSELVGKLMALAQDRDICIWNVLHMNPRPGNDDESKMRGHLGTELGNKVSDTLVCVKQKSANGPVFTVKQVDARGKDLDDWRFEVTDDAGGLGIPKIFASGGNLPSNIDKSDTEEDIRAWLNEAALLPWPMTKKDIKDKVFRDIGKVSNNDRRQTDLEYAIQKGLIVKSEEKTKNGYALFDVAQDMPF